MSKGLFITGTDTGVGKTTVALSIMRALQEHGLQVAGMKPVASGCERTTEGLRNDDAVKLQSQSSVVLPYEWINPFAYEPPIAPHIAAEIFGETIDIRLIRDCYAKIAAQVDVVIVEGAGGWLVPINDEETMADVAVSLGLPIINVVAIQLGCLNRAMLTKDAIRASGATLIGWVANVLDRNTLVIEENIAALRKRTHAELLRETDIDVDFLISRLGFSKVR